MKTVLKYPGAKNGTAKWIISFFPEHVVYLEPFLGSGGVFFNKQPSKIEALNDIDDEVVNYFRVLRENPNELIEQIQNTPFSVVEYEESRKQKQSDDSVEKARKFAVKCFMGIGNSMVHKTGFRRSKESGSSSKAKTWSMLPIQLQEATVRLKNAQIENSNAIDLINRYDSRDVLIYCDPPYMLSTRKGYLYKHEMDDAAHIELLSTLLKHKGKVIISGYDNDLYNSMLFGWNKEYKITSSEKGSRVETLWMNFDIQPRLF